MDESSYLKPCIILLLLSLWMNSVTECISLFDECDRQFVNVCFANCVCDKTSQSGVHISSICEVGLLFYTLWKKNEPQMLCKDKDVNGTGHLQQVSSGQDKQYIRESIIAADQCNIHSSKHVSYKLQMHWAFQSPRLFFNLCDSNLF